MKRTTTTRNALAAVALLSFTCQAYAATIVDDDFSTNTLSNFTTSSVVYESSAETVRIARGADPVGSFQVDDLGLSTLGATDFTIAFDFSFGSSMFGAEFALQYRANDSDAWEELEVFAYNSNRGGNNNDGIVGTTNLAPLDSVSDTTNSFSGHTYSATFLDSALTFEDDSDLRIVDIQNQNGKTMNIDNLSVTAVPEPGSLALGLVGLGALAMRRRRG